MMRSSIRRRSMVVSIVAMFSVAAAVQAASPHKPEAKTAPQASKQQDNPLLRAARHSDANPDSARKRAYRYHDPKQGWAPADPARLKPWVKPAPPASTSADAKPVRQPKPKP